MKIEIGCVVVGLSLLGLCGCSPASEKVVRQVQSGVYTATVAERNSGAMSAGSTLVSIILSTVPDNDTHGEIVFGIRGKRNVSISWLDNRHLFVSCADCKDSDVNFEAVRTGDVSISYAAELAP